MLYGTDYDEPYCELCCTECEEKDSDFKDAADYLEGVIVEIYATSNLDIELLQHNLENLCHILKVKIPKQEAQVVRKSQSHPMLQEWVTFNANYFKSIVYN